MSTLRDDSTPERRAGWDAVERAASRAVGNFCPEDDEPPWRDGQTSPAPEAQQIEAAMTLVVRELERARAKHAPMHSAHEGYAVILEELDELKAEVWRHRLVDTAPAAMLTEAIQVAAMAVRFVLDICGPELHRVTESEAEPEGICTVGNVTKPSSPYQVPPYALGRADLEVYEANVRAEAEVAGVDILAAIIDAAEQLPNPPSRPDYGVRRVWHTYLSLAIVYERIYARTLSDSALLKHTEYYSLAAWARRLYFNIVGEPDKQQLEKQDARALARGAGSPEQRR